MELKDDGKPKKMTWRVFRPKPKPEPSVAPQKIILVPSKQTQNPQSAPRISTGITQQKPASTPGSPLQPKRGQITVGVNHQKPASTLDSPLKPKRGPIAGNPNQMESGGQITGGPQRTGNHQQLMHHLWHCCQYCFGNSVFADFGVFNLFFSTAMPLETVKYFDNISRL